MAGATSGRFRVGAVLLVLGLSCDALGVSMTIAPKPDADPGSGPITVAIGLIALTVPGLWLMLSARRHARREARIDAIVALAKTCERVPLARLAEDLHISHKQTRALLLEAVARHRIEGRLDLEEGVFISASVAVEMKTVTCRECGADASVLPSAQACPYCGSALA